MRRGNTKDFSKGFSPSRDQQQNQLTGAALEMISPSKQPAQQNLDESSNRLLMDSSF
jgi:hypothetical protein